jgi:hypothetical protein
MSASTSTSKTSRAASALKVWGNACRPITACARSPAAQSGAPDAARAPRCPRASLAARAQSGVGGVVLGGTAIFSAMNGFTPHMAGAIDIMVVEQPDGTLKCSPFYGARRAQGAGVPTPFLQGGAPPGEGKPSCNGAGGPPAGAAAPRVPTATRAPPARPQCGLASTPRCAQRTRSCASASTVSARGAAITAKGDRPTAG